MSPPWFVFQKKVWKYLLLKICELLKTIHNKSRIMKKNKEGRKHYEKLEICFNWIRCRHYVYGNNTRFCWYL